MSAADDDDDHDRDTSGYDTDSSLSGSDVSSEEEEEPRLKYQRLGAGVSDILKSDAASCLTAHEKFLVLGTAQGRLHILDFNGYEIKRYEVHGSRVNDISLDEAGDYIASCSDDGTVVVVNLFGGGGMPADHQSKSSYRRPVQSVALHPRFVAKGTTDKVALGGSGQQLVLKTKGWIGDKDTVIHAGEGPIHAVAWRGNLIAWANDVGVKVFDVETNERVTFVGRERGCAPPEQYRCCLRWQSDSTLIIGWADSIKIGTLQYTDEINQGAGGLRRDDLSVRNLVRGSSGPRRRQMVISTVFQTDFFICGISPFGDDIICLAFVTDSGDSDSESDQDDDDGDDEQAPQTIQKLASRPELRILTKQNQLISSDALPIHGYQHYQALDYRFDVTPAPESEKDTLFYIVSPKDIVVARPRDLDDHLAWLLERERYQEALAAAEENPSAMRRHTLQDIGERYLTHLIETGSYDDVPVVMPKLCQADAELWEKWIFTFAKINQLRHVICCVPTKNPQLSPTVYEMLLNHFLEHDHPGFLHTIRTWPNHIYDMTTVITAVIDRLNEQNSEVLMDALGELYVQSEQHERALSVYLSLQRGNIFQLINEHNLISHVRNKVLPLMQFDKLDACELFRRHADEIPVDEVIKQLEPEPRLQYEYLHCLFTKDNFSASEFHDLQVKLYAQFDSTYLLYFLRHSNFYNLHEALEICQQEKLYRGQVYILGRMGNLNDALSLIIKEIGDIKMAIEFVEEHKDDQLWDDLINHCLQSSQMVSDLLEHVGAHNVHVNARQLIARIPVDLTIPQLTDKMRRILGDFILEASLRRGANEILQADLVSLLERLNRLQKRAICVVNGTAQGPTTNSTNAKRAPAKTRRNSRRPRSSVDGKLSAPGSPNSVRSSKSAESSSTTNQQSPKMSPKVSPLPSSSVEAQAPPPRPSITKCAYCKHSLRQSPPESEKQTLPGEAPPELLVFWCGHAFHAECLAQKEKNQQRRSVKVLDSEAYCPLCSEASRKGKARLSKTQRMAQSRQRRKTGVGVEL